MSRQIGKAFVSLMILVSCWPQVAAEPSDRTGSGLSTRASRLSRVLHDGVDSGYVGSAIGLLARSGKILFLEAAGEAAPGVPMDENAIVRLASMTKPVTATAVMILDEQGALSIDDPVGKHIPAFFKARVRAEDESTVMPARPITIKDLLTHTAGVAVSGPEFEEVWELAMAPGNAITTLELSERIARIPMPAQPGTSYAYGFYGSSYEILSAIIEVASGTTLDRFFSERIFGPLGMKDSYLSVPEEKKHRIPARYRRQDDRLVIHSRQGEEPPASRFRSGGGGMRTTIHDYFRFAQCLLNGGELEGVRLLRPETVRLMMTDHVGDLHPSPAGGWGFGGRVQAVDADGVSAGVYGWNGGTGAFFWIDPKEELIGILFAPFNPPPPSEIYGRFFEAAY